MSALSLDMCPGSHRAPLCSLRPGIRLLWLRVDHTVRPRACCLVLGRDILGAAELPSHRALYLQTRPMRQARPQGLIRVRLLMSTHTSASGHWATLVDKPPCGCNLRLPVTNVVGNLFRCGFATGISSFIKCLLGVRPTLLRRCSQHKWAFKMGV